jgi:hypothetical protein
MLIVDALTVWSSFGPPINDCTEYGTRENINATFHWNILAVVEWKAWIPLIMFICVQT